MLDASGDHAATASGHSGAEHDEQGDACEKHQPTLDRNFDRLNIVKFLV